MHHHLSNLKTTFDLVTIQKTNKSVMLFRNQLDQSRKILVMKYLTGIYQKNLVRDRAGHWTFFFTNRYHTIGTSYEVVPESDSVIL